MITKTNTTGFHKLPVKVGRLAINAEFQKRWILVGLLLVLMAYAGVFFNYHLVYAGIVEEVTIQSGDIHLAGVIVKPDTPGPHPGIVLLHHAGPQSYGKWFYRIHTNVFVRQGFAVLTYDQRGSGGSEGDLRKTGFTEMVSDGAAAVALLRSQSDVIPDQIGLFGASESGWFTPEIASTVGDIAFIINKASPPLPWITTVLFEVKSESVAAGVSEADLKEILSLQARIYQFYVDAVADESVANGPEREAINDALDEMQNRLRVEDVLIAILPEYDQEI